MAIFEVMVGNIGLVYAGNNYMQACTKYNNYVKDSRANYGRVAGESVTMLHNDKIKFEYIGTNNEQEEE